jgi:hypothetical protein
VVCCIHLIPFHGPYQQDVDISPTVQTMTQKVDVWLSGNDLKEVLTTSLDILSIVDQPDSSCLTACSKAAIV